MMLFRTVAALLLLAMATPAAAQDVTFRFSGVITWRAAERSFPDIVEGTSFTGAYTFNLNAADTNDGSFVADYVHHSGPYGIAVDIGPHRFETDPSAVDFWVELVNEYFYDGRDNYLLRSYNNLPASGMPVSHISWQLDDPSGAALDNVELSANPPDLARWTQIVGLYVELVTDEVFVGRITTIEVFSDGNYLAALPAPPDEGIPGPPGPMGPEGPAGPAGPAGPQGEVGFVGPEGPEGPQGEAGPAGPEGPQGRQGDVGPRGPQGSQGEVGAHGAQGAAGATGAQGPQGATGPAGAQGEGLMRGSLLTVPAGSPAPAGYTFVGTFDLTPSGGSRGRPAMMSVDVYMKN